jgi:hypothetical protein
VGVVGVPPLATVCGVEPGAVANPPVAGVGAFPLTPQSPVGGVDAVCGVVGVGCPGVVGVGSLLTVVGVVPVGVLPGVVAVDGVGAVPLAPQEPVG